MNIVVYRYQNNTYLKHNETDLKLAEYKKLLAQRVYLLSYIDIFYKLVQNLTMGEVDFKQFLRLRNKLVIPVENLAREEDSSPELILTMSKVIDEPLKLAHKVVDVVDQANRKICAILLRYNVDKPDSSYAQVRIFARKEEDENFQLNVYVNHILQEFFHLLGVINFVYDKDFTNQPICNVP